VITDLTLENIRGISKGTLAGLSPISIFVGPNNSGKSTILDALFLGANVNPAQAIGALRARMDVSEPQRWFLRSTIGNGESSGRVTVKLDSGQDRIVNVDSKLQISISSTHEAALRLELKDLESQIGQSQRSDRHELTERKRQMMGQIAEAEKLRSQDWPVPDVILYDPRRSTNGRSLPELYTLAAESGLSDQVNGILTDLLPDVKRVELLAPQGKPVVYLSMKSGAALPVGIAGDGVRLLLRLSMELAVRKGGIALLEEPETHLHPGAIRQAARAIQAAAGRDIQIAMSTHSLELIDALLTEFPEHRERITVFRTAIDENGVLLTHRAEGNDAYDARTKIAEDLR